MGLSDIFQKRYTLDILADYLRTKQQTSKNNLSSKCKILIIDDYIDTDKYPLGEELELLKKSQSYNITTKSELDSLNDAAAYDLIICDNEGIGRKICGSKGNGISLLKLLIAEYPGKRYVMLSNKEIKINRLESFAKLSAKISVWDKDTLVASYNANGEKGLGDHIKREVERTIDPVVRWKEIRRSFVVNTNISLYDLASIENSYIKSIIKNKPEIYDKAISKINLIDNDGNISNYLKATKTIIDFTVAIVSVI